MITTVRRSPGASAQAAPDRGHSPQRLSAQPRLPAEPTVAHSLRRAQIWIMVRVADARSCR